MAEAGRVAEKIPGWVEWVLIPSLETRVRGIVREEMDHLAKVQDAKFDSIGTKFEGIETRFESIGSRIDSLEKRMEGGFEAMEARFDGIEAKFDGVGARFDGTDAKIDSLEKRLALVQDVADLKARLAAVERRNP